MSSLAKGALKSYINRRSIAVRGRHELERYPPVQLSLARIEDTSLQRGGALVEGSSLNSSTS